MLYRPLTFDVSTWGADGIQIAIAGDGIGMATPFTVQLIFELGQTHARARFAGGRRTAALALGHDPRLAHRFQRPVPPGQNNKDVSF